MKSKNIILVFIIAMLLNIANAQEGMPIYTDYLTDNYYLIHPSMAGVSKCAKVRLTGRQQWFGEEDAPKLLTLSINGKIGNSQSSLGGILYTDKNGYHSQNGAYLTYAHHILFSKNAQELNKLSFGLSAGFIQYRLDESSFDTTDILIGGDLQSNTNLNIDFGFSYNYLEYYLHVTTKNLLENSGINNDIQVTSNLRRYLVSIGGILGKESSNWSYEPSLMFMYKDGTRESSIDINAKAYRSMDFGSIWAGVSYRYSFDRAEFSNAPNNVSSQNLQNITPLVGINFNDFMFSYNYTYQTNSVVFTNGGFHQFTLGYDFNCKADRYSCRCPSVN